jgi:hypothetical protein
MTDNFVDRSAERLGEFVIVQGRRIGIVGNDEVVNNLIDIIRSYSCLDDRVTQIQSLTSE